jgi:TRAP transporter TAXI family solute receptor
MFYGAGAEAQQSAYFRIGTANATGTYFKVGGVLASAISAPSALPNCRSGGGCGVPGLIAIARASQGSVENVRMLGNGDLESAFVQADVASWAFHGTGPYARKPIADLRAIAALFPEYAHLVVRRDGPIRNFRDLKGKRVALGEKESGTLADVRLLLEATGLKERDLNPEYPGLGDATAGLRDGTLDAFFMVGGTPLPAIADLAASVPIRLIPIPADVVKTMVGRNPLAVAATLPAGEYPGIDDATPTVAVNAIWVVTADAADQLVYAIAKSLWDEATQRVIAMRQPMPNRMTLAHALDGVDIPLHPGAERFYGEAGLTAQTPR